MKLHGIYSPFSVSFKALSLFETGRVGKSTVMTRGRMSSGRTKEPAGNRQSVHGCQGKVAFRKRTTRVNPHMTGSAFVFQRSAYFFHV